MGFTFKYTLILSLLALLFIFPTSSCRTMKKMSNNQQRRQDMRQMAKEKKQREAEAQKAYMEAVKRNGQGQTRKTRKAMKQNFKKSQRHRSGKGEFFLKRWFTPKSKRVKRPPGL